MANAEKYFFFSRNSGLKRLICWLTALSPRPAAPPRTGKNIPIVLPAASRRRKNNGNIFTCSGRRCGSRRKRCEPADQSLQPAVPREEEIFFRIGHDSGARPDRPGHGGLLRLRLLAGRETRAPDRRLSQGLRAAETGVRQSYRGPQSGETRCATRSGPEEH